MMPRPDLLPSAQQRAEASTVTTSRAGHQFEIQLGHMCNNRCLFCSSGQLTGIGLARPIPIDPIISAIEDAHRGGARRLTFLGGEPTLHRGFLAALRRAVELGFAEIVIFTNGVVLPQPGFLDTVCALGRFEWRISIQGGNEAAHVAVTRRKHSFQRIVEGLELLRGRGQRITVNLCMNEESYRSLPDFPALVRRYGIDQLHADVIRPASVGATSDAYLRAIMPRYALMVPYLREMLEGFAAHDPGFDVNVGNLPYCLMPDWASHIHHGGEPTVTRACDAEGLEPDVDKYAWHASMRRHVPKCEGCVFRASCSGVFGEYLALYGDEELRPITRAELAAVDRAGRSFVLLVEPYLRGLRATLAEGVAGFTLARWSEDALSRRVEVRLEAAGGAVVELRCTPPTGDTDDSAFRTDRFGIALAIAGQPGAASLRALLAALAAALDGGLAPSDAPPARLERALDVEAIVARAAGPDPLRRGRALVLQWVRAVERQGRFGPWRYTGARAREGGPGSVVELRGDDGGRIDLLFALGLQDGRPQLSFDYRAAEGTPEDTARAVAGEVLRALRSLAPVA
jgi:wyosine [tRNA(Phe)-imidazoG37] synthetase (radical SAM superfamily)